MGLDIYIRRYTVDREAMEVVVDRYEAESSARFEAMVAKHGKFDSAPQGDRDAYWAGEKQARAALGLDEHGGIPSKDMAQPSAKHPQHYMNLGYFRSSYNGSGFDNVIHNLLGVYGFYHIFGRADGDEYEFQPDWAASKARTEALLAAYDEAKASDGGALRVSFEGRSLNPSPPQNDAAALAIFRREAAGRKNVGPDGFTAYSNRDGLFLLGEPMRVVALIPGLRWKEMGVYVITRDAVDAEDWYRPVFEIVIEACDRVLGMTPEERAQVWMAWSG